MLNPNINKENNDDSYEKEMKEIKNDLIKRKADKYFQKIQEIRSREKDDSSDKKDSTFPAY